MAEQRREMGEEEDKKVGKTSKRLRAGEDVKEQKKLVVSFGGVGDEVTSETRVIVGEYGDPYMNVDVEDLEFGRYTNRNDYFPVIPWNLNSGKNLFGLASHNGGGGRTQQVPLGVSSNNDGAVFLDRLNPETGGCSTTSSYTPDRSAEVIALEQKLITMQKEQHAREEALNTQLEVERKRVADLQAQHVELSAKMAEQARLSEQFSIFMRQYQSQLPPQSPPQSS